MFVVFVVTDVISVSKRDVLPALEAEQRGVIAQMTPCPSFLKFCYVLLAMLESEATDELLTLPGNHGLE